MVQNYLLNSARKNAKSAASQALFRTILAVILVFSVLISIKPASAALLKDVAILDHLEKDFSMVENINISLSENTGKSFPLTLPGQASKIIVNGKSYNNSNLSIPLNCTECNIQISYSINNIVKKSGHQLSFYRTLNFPITPAQLSYRIFLPIGYRLNMSDQANPSIVPKPSDISTDGEHITIGWKETNPKLPLQYLVVYYDTEPSESLAYIIRNDLTHASVVIFGILLLAVGFAAGFLVKSQAAKNWLKKIPKGPAKHYVIPSSLLSPDEKIILDFLKRKGAKKNPVNQKEIGKELEWSKSKVSAVLSNLYYKKIIDREKFGRNYKVKIVKEVQ
jgi:uncharacterized membrane protein